MNEPGILVFLQSISVDYRNHTYNGDWLNIRCPMAQWYHAKGRDENPSFGVRIDDKRKSSFKCLACQQKGSLSRLAGVLGKLRGIDYSQQQHWIEMAELQAIASRPMREWDDQYDDDDFEAQVANFKPAPHHEYEYPLAVGLPYLRKRGLMWNDVYRLGLRFDPYQRRVLFPVYDEERSFMGFSGRSILPPDRLDKKNPKVRDYFGLKKRQLLLNHRHIDKTLTTVPGVFGRQLVVEGLFDYGRWYTHGFVNTNATLGTSLTEEKLQIFIDRGLPVYLLFDPDKAGIDAVYGTENVETGERDTHLSWAHNLCDHVPVWICEYPEGCELDPGSIHDKKIAVEIVKNAKLFSPSSVKNL